MNFFTDTGVHHSSSVAHRMCQSNFANNDNLFSLDIVEDVCVCRSFVLPLRLVVRNHIQNNFTILRLR